MNNAGLTTYPEIYMPCPFAGEADAGGTSGTNRSKDFSDAKSAANVNMRTGFPTIFTRAQSLNGKYLSRPDMNQLGYMATVGQYRKQIGCLNEFNAAFASKIQGYAKGAVLDYVVYHDATNHLVSEVWKIVSLIDKNSTAPTSSNILSFGTDSSTAGAGDKLWMRIVPDKAYIETIQSECHTYADGIVANEKARAVGVEATKINTDTANAKFTNGIPKLRSSWSTSTPNDGCIDGTALDKDGNECEVNVAVASTDLADLYYSELLGKKVPIAKYGHVHTNIYTKAEVDAKIGAMGGMYANGSTQKSGYSDGTYSVYTQDGVTSYYGHKHTDYCANSESSSHGDNSHDGTYSESTRGTITTKYGHVHTDYAKKTDVYDTTASDSGFARGGTHGVTDCTAKDASDNILKPNYNTQTITYSDGTTAPKAVYGTIAKGHVHTNYATTEYVSDNFATKDHTHSGMGGGGTDYIDSTWHSASLLSESVSSKTYSNSVSATHDGYAFIRVMMDTAQITSPSKFFIEIFVENMSIGKCGASYIENSFIATVPIKKDANIQIVGSGTENPHESSVSIQLLYKE